MAWASSQHGSLSVVELLTWQLVLQGQWIQRTRQKWYGLLSPNLGSHVDCIPSVKAVPSPWRFKRKDREPVDTDPDPSCRRHVSDNLPLCFKTTQSMTRKPRTNLDSMLKSRDITLLSKVHLVQAMVFPIVMYGCDSGTTKKAEHQRIDAFELWSWRRLLRVPWTARRSNQEILKEIHPEYSLKGLMLKLKLQYSGHLM